MLDYALKTGLTKGEAQLHSQDLVDIIKNSTLSGSMGTQVNMDETLPAQVEEPYPVICLINGSGGCGKGTFIQLIQRYNDTPVYELSTVDPLRPIARTLMEYQQDNLIDVVSDRTTIMKAEIEESEKGGPYRQLLSDLKTAWANHNDGPNEYIVGTVVGLITNNHMGINPHNGLPITVGLNLHMPAVIFVNVREPENIDKLKEAFWGLGLLCFTLKMEGIEHKVEDLAKSDLLVDDYEYDLIIKNKGTIDDLGIQAFVFNTFLKRGNAMFGVSSKYRGYSEAYIAGKQALDEIDKMFDTIGAQFKTIGIPWQINSIRNDYQEVISITQDEYDSTKSSGYDILATNLGNRMYLDGLMIVDKQVCHGPLSDKPNQPLTDSELMDLIAETLNSMRVNPIKIKESAVTSPEKEADDAKPSFPDHTVDSSELRAENAVLENPSDNGADSPFN